MVTPFISIVWRRHLFFPLAKVNVVKQIRNVNFSEDYKSENQKIVVFNHPPHPLSKWRHWLSDPRASTKRNNEQSFKKVLFKKVRRYCRKLNVQTETEIKFVFNIVWMLSNSKDLITIISIWTWWTTWQEESFVYSE